MVTLKCIFLDLGVIYQIIYINKLVFNHPEGDFS